MRGDTLPARQRWLEHALQGLAFWIGHRHSMFKAYPLAEGALVAEACNLIQANLPSDLELVPECMYGNIVDKGAKLDGVTDRSRADLVLCSKQENPIKRDGNIAQIVRFVIEVKRGSAPKRQIDADIKRLYAYLQASQNDSRAFLFVISEGRSQPRFIKDGKSILKDFEIPETDGIFRVRRTVKAAASFKGKSTAHYVCLIEVFLHRKDRPKPI